MTKNIITLVLTVAVTVALSAQINTPLTEEFDDITTNGWMYVNNSDSPNLDYFQGNPAVFNANTGAPEAYLAVNFSSTAGSVISNWAISPELVLEPGAEFTYYTRTVTGNTFPDGSELRISTSGASVDVGTAPTDVGDFTEVAVDVNTALASGGYPDDWMQFTYTYNGPATTGRVAFRYVVSDGGPFGSNSNYIGFDDFTFTPPAEIIPTMGEWGLISLGMLLMIFGVVAVGQRRSAMDVA